MKSVREVAKLQQVITKQLDGLSSKERRPQTKEDEKARDRYPTNQCKKTTTDS